MTENQNPFDPHFMRPAPVVAPVEHEIARIEAAAELVLTRCGHCTPDIEVVSRDDGVPRAIGVTHQKGCPDWLPDWPPDKPAA